MKLTRSAVRKPVSTIMICVGIVLLGYISLRNLSIDLLPNLSFPKLSVITEYSGVSSEEIEKLVSEPLETTLASISGVKHVSSVSREGVSIVTLEFHWGTDMNFALLHTKEKVEEVNSQLPENVTSRPRIVEWDPSSKPIVIAVIEPHAAIANVNLAEIRETAEFLIKPRLEQLEGVSRVDVQGGGEYEVVVAVKPDKLALYNISFADVVEGIRAWNQTVMAGIVKKDKTRFVVRIEGEIKKLDDIEKIPLRPLPAGQLMIRDIAIVSFTEKQKQGEIRFNRNPTVALMIYKEASGNTVAASRTVRRTFQQMEKEFPNLRFRVISEEAGLIITGISNLKGSLVQGGILAFLVLLIFFQNWRDPILVALISPISVLATFILMFFSGVNLNIMSLGGLALGIGIYMDNAIIVIENMNRLHSLQNSEEAAINGTVELVPALMGSTFTTIVIFLPVIYIYGISGRLFRDQSLTISFALLSALLLTLTLLPTLFRIFSPDQHPLQTSLLPEPERRNGFLSNLHRAVAGPFLLFGFAMEAIVTFFLLVFNLLRKAFLSVSRPLLQLSYRIFNRAYKAFEQWYHGYLIRSLEKKSTALWITLAMLIGTILFYSLVKKELLPQTQTSRFEIMLATQASLGFEETEYVAVELEKGLLVQPNIISVFTKVGTNSNLDTQADNISVNNVKLIVECRGRGSRERLMHRARQLVKSLPSIDSVSVFPEQNTLSEYLRFGTQEFQIKVFYEKIEDGLRVVEDISNRLRKIHELVDLRANTEQGKPILAIRYNEDVLNRLELSKSDISNQVSYALRGENISTYRMFQKSYDIVISTPIRNSRQLEQVLQMPINVGSSVLPFGQLIRFEHLTSIKEINRESQERFFTITANLQGGKVAEVSIKVERALRGLLLPAGVRYIVAGEEEERKTAFHSVGLALILSIILVYMVMAAEFENLIHPLIIMLTIPMGFLGAFVALFITGDTINVISGIGLMVAVGIVCDDAIVKIEAANHLREKGLSIRDCLLGASRLRLRPIILNTLTTVFGVLPMIYMTGVGTELQKPMAVVIFGSLISSTFLTLVLIPVLYEMVTKPKKVQTGP